MAPKYKFQIQLKGKFQDFWDDESGILCRAYLSGSKKASYTFRGTDYEYDFTAMTQTNKSSGKSRRIRPPYKMKPPEKPLVKPGPTMMAIVPPNAKSGDRIMVPHPSQPGVQLQVTVPPGARPGATLLVPVPNVPPPVRQPMPAPSAPPMGGPPPHHTGQVVIPTQGPPPGQPMQPGYGQPPPGQQVVIPTQPGQGPPPTAPQDYNGQPGGQPLQPRYGEAPPPAQPDGNSQQSVAAPTRSQGSREEEQKQQQGGHAHAAVGVAAGLGVAAVGGAAIAGGAYYAHQQGVDQQDVMNGAANAGDGINDAVNGIDINDAALIAEELGDEMAGLTGEAGGIVMNMFSDL